MQAAADEFWKKVQVAQAAILAQHHLAGEADYQRDELLGIDRGIEPYAHFSRAT